MAGGPLTIGNPPLPSAATFSSASWFSRYSFSRLRYSRSKARSSSTLRSSSSRGLHQRAHGLAVPLLRVALERLGAGTRVADDLLGLAARLAEDVVGLAAGPVDRLVGLPAGVGDRLVGGLLGQREHAGRRVHVVLGRRHAHADGNRLLRLHRLGRAHAAPAAHHHLGLGLGDRGWAPGHAHAAGTLPRRHSASLARSSSFSWISRSSSASTSSRKASTSSSS